MKKLFYKEDSFEKIIYHFLGIKIKVPSKGYFPPKTTESKVKISVVINTYNAERLLEEAIKSVKDAYEIVICDMHSTDKTIEIAEKYNCKIYYHEKLPQPDPARNFAISKATGDWILILDADEIIPENLWNYLNDYANCPILDKLAISIPRKNWFLDGFLNHIGEDYQLRFFKKGYVEYEEGFVHMPPKAVNTEIFLLRNRVIKDLIIYHYSYPNLTEFINRQNIYSSEEINKEKFANNKISKFKIILVLLNGIYNYYKKGLYKDGFGGLCWALYCGIYNVNINLKSLEKSKDFKKLQELSIQDLISRGNQ